MSCINNITFNDYCKHLTKLKISKNEKDIIEQLKKMLFLKKPKILLDNFTDVLTTDILLFMFKEYDHYLLKTRCLIF